MSSSSDLVGRPDEAVRPLDLPTLRCTILAGLVPRQAEAASLSGPVLVLAGAGTGKTRPLTAGVARRIGARGTNPDRILDVTFTNGAAKDMADRIRTILTGQRAPSWIGCYGVSPIEPFRVSRRTSSSANDRRILALSADASLTICLSIFPASAASPPA